MFLIKHLDLRNASTEFIIEFERFIKGKRLFAVWFARILRELAECSSTEDFI